jgi:hypothetical protein
VARKYYGSFYSVTGKLHRVEIWDGANGTTPEITARLYASRVQSAGGYQEGQTCLLDSLQGLNSSIELTLSGEGYTIERDGEGDTFYENSIRASRSTSFWSIPVDTILGEFKQIATNTEQYKRNQRSNWLPSMASNYLTDFSSMPHGLPMVK